jgi:hypothetical protein
MKHISAPLAGELLVADFQLPLFHLPAPENTNGACPEGLRRCFFSIYPEYQIGGGELDIFEKLYCEANQWVRQKGSRLGA